MIFMESYLNVCDNSGCRLIKCIKVLKIGKNLPGIPGDMVVGSYKHIFKHTKYLKGKICFAIILRTKKLVSRVAGDLVSSKLDNSAILLKKGDLVPISNKVYGPVFLEARASGVLRSCSLSLGLF